MVSKTLLTIPQPLLNQNVKNFISPLLLIWGKSLRDGSAKIFGLRRHPDFVEVPCPRNRNLFFYCKRTRYRSVYRASFLAYNKLSICIRRYPYLSILFHFDGDAAGLPFSNASSHMVMMFCSRTTPSKRIQIWTPQRTFCVLSLCIRLQHPMVMRLDYH